MGDLIDRQAAINVVRKAKDKSEAHRMLLQLPPAQLAQDLPKGCTDTISRQEAISAIEAHLRTYTEPYVLTEREDAINYGLLVATDVVANRPSAQPEPLSDVYTKAVWTWLVDYQIKAAELKGRYTPYEVLSWVVNDWRKEHERSD